MRMIVAALLGVGLTGATSGAGAEELRPGGKLLLTGGVSSIEGAGGGGLATWAVITGYETRDGVGANVHATLVSLPDYEFTAGGVAIGILDALELSYSRQALATQDAGAKLGIGQGFTFHQDVWGAKLRVYGDAVYDQDRWAPQISVGGQYKRGDREGLVKALGARSADGIDYYVAATKILLDQSLVLNGTVRATKANQTGLLGFGGPKNAEYQARFEGSAALLLNRRLAVGVEYRGKPDNLDLKEDDWMDVFAAYAVNKALSVTAGYADLGKIATFGGQRGLYLSLQAGF